MMLRKCLTRLLTGLLCVLTLAAYLPVHAQAAASVTYEPEVKKVVRGTTTQTFVFNFTLTQVGGAPMPDGTVGGVKTATRNGEGMVGFGEITYTQPGEYHYEVRETPGTDLRFTYDSTVYDLTVYVAWTDNTFTALTTDVTAVRQGEDVKQPALAFTNVFSNSSPPSPPDPVDPPKPPVPVDPDPPPSGDKGNPVEVDPPVTKQVTGTDAPSDSVFTFVMQADDPTYPMPSGSENGVKTVTHTGAGEIEFGNIRYVETGRYTYRVYERAGSETGYTYDSVIYSVTVDVSLGTDGNLKAERLIIRRTDNQQTADTALFVNAFDALPEPPPPDIEGTPVQTEPTLEKQVRGANAPSDSMFTFRLEAVESGTPMPAGSNGTSREVQLRGPGKCGFGAITYEKTGVYTYRVYEYRGSEAGYTYDNTVYRLQVYVDIDENDALTARQILTRESGGAKADSLLFVNTYTQGAAPEPADDISSNRPQTGDLSRDGLWWLLLTASAGGMLLAVLDFRRGKRSA